MQTCRIRCGHRPANSSDYYLFYIKYFKNLWPAADVVRRLVCRGVAGGSRASGAPGSGGSRYAPRKLVLPAEDWSEECCCRGGGTSAPRRKCRYVRLSAAEAGKHWDRGECEDKGDGGDGGGGGCGAGRRNGKQGCK